MTTDESTERARVVGNYRRGRKLGRGAFSTVYECTDITTNQKYAMKQLDLERIIQENLKEPVEREMAIMQSVNHPNIIRLIHVMKSKKNLYLILELATDGELFARICGTEEGLSEDQARLYFQQLVNAVGFLHEHGIFHRDLKGENCLMSGDQLKLADFGLSIIARSVDQFLQSRCGSPLFASPELLMSPDGYQGGPHDVWGLGVILYSMLTRQFAFDAADLNQLARMVSRPESAVRYPSTVPNGAKDLMQRIFVANPSARITIPQIKQHPWFRVGYVHVDGVFNKIPFAMKEAEERGLNAFELIGLMHPGLGGLVREGRSSAVHILTKMSQQDAFDAIVTYLRAQGYVLEISGLSLKSQAGSGYAAAKFKLEMKPPLVGTKNTLIEIARLEGAQVAIMNLVAKIRQQVS